MGMGYTSMYFLLFFGWNKGFITFFLLTLIYSASNVYHKEKNFPLDEQILSFKIDPHLRKAAKIYGTTSTDPDQSTQVLSYLATSI